jgi:hypothetical protein
MKKNSVILGLLLLCSALAYALPSVWFTGICPVCEFKSKLSRVQLLDERTLTSYEVIKYWDTNGVYKVVDSNIVQRAFVCSRDHRFQTISRGANTNKVVWVVWGDEQSVSIETNWPGM